MSDNNNQNIIKLYNSVWNNKYLKCLIFDYLKIYNILKCITFYNTDEWENFKYKEYLYQVTFEFRYSLNLIPSNIKHVKIQPLENPNQIIKIPTSIESFSLLFLSSLYLDSPFYNSVVLTRNPKINSLKIFSSNGLPLPIIKPTSFPSSITNLELRGSLQQDLKKDIIPSNIRKLVIQGVKNYSVDENGSFLPQSLTDISICSNPIIVNHLPKNNLTKLILVAFEGSNTPLKIDEYISFPHSLQYLDVSCLSFNTTLPTNLKTFRLIVNQLTNEIKFPSSLQNLYISSPSSQIKTIYDLFKCSDPLNNLKKLDLDIGNITLVDKMGNSCIPDKVEKLILKSFNQELKPNHLPSNLNQLYLGSPFDKNIEVGVLPLKLKKLSLFNCTHPINPLSIPSSLNHLEIKRTNLNQLFKLNNPNIIIDADVLSLYYNTDMIYIKVLKLPTMFIQSLSSLSLQDKSSLEYLHLGYGFNRPILRSDLPVQNNIKTLVLSVRFNQTINLADFYNLEDLIVQEFSKCKIITTKDNNNNYNYFNLKNIIVSNNNILKYIDINYYRFIKFKK